MYSSNLLNEQIPDLLAWLTWSETAGNRTLAFTLLPDGAELSTVCFGLDYDSHASGPLIVYETMVFGGVHDGECWRWRTRAEAIKGHTRIVALAARGWV